VLTGNPELKPFGGAFDRLNVWQLLIGAPMNFETDPVEHPLNDMSQHTVRLNGTEKKCAERGV
jgi:hypothetical protein